MAGEDLPALVVVLIASGLAAVTAMAGVLPLIGRTAPPLRWLGWANAIAAGLMLASAFVLTDAALEAGTAGFAIGAVVGVLFVHATRTFSGTEDLDLNDLGRRGKRYRSEVLLVSVLHAGVEGIAIGSAFAVDTTLGIFVALTMAAHNIPEAMNLAAVFRARDAALGRAALIALISNAPQVLLAIFSFALLAAVGGLAALALGFAGGALVYLVMVDLLPESYREAGPTSIAVGIVLSMGTFALLHGWVR